ncbi:MAG: glycosyltransferase [Verrucomicrobiota bacterium]
MKRLHQAAKFFFEGERKVFLQGVTYGPFEPRTENGPYLPEEGRVVKDFEMMQEAGINLVRLYHQPPVWFLDRAGESGIRVLTTVPWPLRGLFLEDTKTRATILKRMGTFSREHSGHPAILGYLVDNEMAPDLVRWLGREEVEQFLNTCVCEVKQGDPEALVSYAGFPPSEYLQPGEVDFYSFNVYLHDRDVFQRYLSRLQNIAGEKPLVLSEFGMDTIRHGEEEQAELLSRYIEDCFRGGAAGSILFSWTDEWFTGGAEITDWAFGLVTKDRRPKLAYSSVGHSFLVGKESLVGCHPLKSPPKVSVVVCSYNGSSTLKGCLEALEKQSYSDYEIIVVDDGSTDDTQGVLAKFPDVTSVRQENMGLSAARNVGIEAAAGEVIAYTDSDCMPDEDWLYFLIQTLLLEKTAAVGGPNISPPAHQWVQAAVAVSPGAPGHVLFNDRRAEHVPGCNMAFWKWALIGINGFDPVYRKAGDDVDVCWKLLDQGYEIAFSPAAVVWHHRRFCVKTYFSQQRGYGEAEALLRFQHLNRFDAAGSARWKGRIYGVEDSASLFYQPIIYYGQFAFGGFQSIYRQQSYGFLHMFGSLQWVALTGFVLLLSTGIPMIRIIPLVMVGATLWAALVNMASVNLESKFDGFKARILVFYLSLSQPLVRAWARYFTWLERQQTPKSVSESEESLPHYRPPWWRCGYFQFWSNEGKERYTLLRSAEELLGREGWRFVLDTGWSNWDIQIFGNRWWHIRIRTQSEAHPGGRQLTRVGVQMMVTSFSLLVGALIWGIGLSVWFSFANYRWIVLCVGLVTLAHWLAGGLRVRRRLAETILAAARKEGISRLKEEVASQ